MTQNNKRLFDSGQTYLHGSFNEQSESSQQTDSFEPTQKNSFNFEPFPLVGMIKKENQWVGEVYNKGGQNELHINNQNIHLKAYRPRAYGNQANKQNFNSSITAKNKSLEVSLSDDQQAVDLGSVFEVFSIQSVIDPSSLEFSTLALPQFPQSNPSIKNKITSDISADYIIVYPQGFKEIAQRYALYRRNLNNRKTEIVNYQDILKFYILNQQDPVALKSFLYKRYQANSNLNVLILGDDHLIPTHQSKNSLHNILSIGSDDFFGIKYFPIGRLPVNTPTEAQDLLNKIIRFENNIPSMSSDFMRSVLMIADDGNNNRFQLQSDYLMKNNRSQSTALQCNRLWMDSYPKVIQPDFEAAPFINHKLEEYAGQKAFWIDYIGHGAGQNLAFEEIVNPEIIEQWTPSETPSFLMAATCEFAHFDQSTNQNNDAISGAEKLLLKKGARIIGVIASTRPMYINSNFEFEQAFWSSFHKEFYNPDLTIGQLFRSAKNNPDARISNSAFTLLADPLLAIANQTDRLELKDENINDNEFSFQLQINQVRKIDSSNKDDWKNNWQNGNLKVEIFAWCKEHTTLGQGRNRKLTYQDCERPVTVLNLPIDDINIKIDLIETLNKISANEKFKTSENIKINFIAKNHESILVPPRKAFYSKILEKSIFQTPDKISDTNDNFFELKIDSPSFSNGGIVSNAPTIIGRIFNENDIDLTSLVFIKSRDSLNFLPSALSTNENGNMVSVEQFLGLYKEGNYDIDLYYKDLLGIGYSDKLSFRVGNAKDFFLLDHLIYPMPILDEFITRLNVANLKGEQPYWLKLFDLQGNLLYQESGKTFFKNKGKAEIRLSLLEISPKQFKPGVYTLQVLVKSEFATHSMLRQKLIVH